MKEGLAVEEQAESLDELQLVLSAWRQAIQKGNQVYASGHIQKARMSYQTALQIVLAMVRSANERERGVLVSQIDGVIAALVVTQHNLADLYVASGLPGRAAEHLCEAHEAVFKLLNHPLHDVVEMARQHLHMTGMELMTFLQKHGDYPRISQTLYATQLTFPPAAPPSH